MGISTHVLLPAQTRIDDVAQVMGILAGLPAEKMPLGGGGWSVRVPRAVVVPSSSQFGCGNIELRGETIDGVSDHHCFVIANSGTGEQAGYNTRHGLWISTGVSPFWREIALGLVRFFGGEVDFNDCDGIDVDFTWPCAPDLLACDGEAWHAFQQRKLNVRPIAMSKQRAA